MELGEHSQRLDSTAQIGDELLDVPGAVKEFDQPPDVLAFQHEGFHVTEEEYPPPGDLGAKMTAKPWLLDHPFPH